MEDIRVDEDEKCSHTDKPDNGANDSQVANHGKVLEEEGLPKAVPGREDDGWEDDGEKHFIIELNFGMQTLHFSRYHTYLAKIAVRTPMKMAIVDSWRYGT